MISAHSDNLPKTYQNVLSIESKIWQDREFAAHTRMEKNSDGRKGTMAVFVISLEFRTPQTSFFSLKSIVKALIQNGT